MEERRLPLFLTTAMIDMSTSSLRRAPAAVPITPPALAQSALPYVEYKQAGMRYWEYLGDSECKLYVDADELRSVTVLVKLGGDGNATITITENTDIRKYQMTDGEWDGKFAYVDKQALRFINENGPQKFCVVNAKLLQ